MYFFYFFWSLSLFFLNFTHIYIEKYFLVKNNPFSVRRRVFKYISYFEKLFLVLFYKNGWFEKSISNLYRKKDVNDYRRNHYPVVYGFHLNFNKVIFSLDNLRFFSKQFNYYRKNIYFKNLFKNLFLFFFSSKNNFLNFLVLQNLYFKKYHNFNNYFYYYYKNNLNLVKFNKIFSLFLFKSSKKLINFNLDKWNDWYSYNFDNSLIKQNRKKKNLSKQKQKTVDSIKNKKLNKWRNIVLKYKKKLLEINKFFGQKFKPIIYFFLNTNSLFKIKINKNFFNLLKYYIIKFSESSVSKYINCKLYKTYNFYYLRKNRIFNKGRYSRNRQLYRTGVYWCLWLNIIMVYGLYFIFYRFSFNFGYFWWGILFLAYSTIFSRISKYNFYNFNYVIKEFNNLIFWYGSLFSNLFYFLEKNLISLFFNMSLFNHISKYKNNNFNFFYSNFYFYFIKFFKNIIDKRKRISITYFWQGMKERDKSFFRYKTVIHWIKQLWRLIIV